jgi:hypothetical protein
VFLEVEFKSEAIKKDFFYLDDKFWVGGGDFLDVHATGSGSNQNWAEFGGSSLHGNGEVVFTCNFFYQESNYGNLDLRRGYRRSTTKTFSHGRPCSPVCFVIRSDPIICSE